MSDDSIKLIISAVLEDAQFQDGVKSIKTGLASASDAHQGFFSQLKSGWLGVTAVIGGFIAAVTAVVKAFIDEQNAFNNLSSAMKNNNQYSLQAMQNMKDYADATQKATNVGKDQVANLLAISINMGATNAQAQQVVNTAIGLNKAVGVDMTRAIRGTIDAMNGHYDSLKRNIPELKNIHDGVRGLNEVLDLGAKGYKEAEDATKTFGGEIATLGLNVKDTEVKLGEMISQGLKPTIAAINEMFATQKDGDGLKIIFQGIAIAVGVFAAMVTSSVRMIVDTVMDGIDVIKGFVQVVEDVFSKEKGHWQKAAADIKTLNETVAKSFIKIGVEMSGAFDSSIAAILAVVKKGNDKLKEEGNRGNKDKATANTINVANDEQYLKYLKQNYDAQVLAENTKWKEILAKADEEGFNLEAVNQQHADNLVKIWDDNHKLMVDLTKAGYGAIMDETIKGLTDTKLSAKAVYKAIVTDFAKMISKQLQIAGEQHLVTAIAELADPVTIPLAPGEFAAAAGLSAAALAVEAIAGSLSFAKGSDEIPFDANARVHKGERIVPADQNIQGISNKAFTAAALRGLAIPSIGMGAGIINNNSTQNQSAQTTNNNIHVTGMTIEDVVQFSRRTGSNPFSR